MWTWTIVFVSLASIALADHMARVRGRSPRMWFWIAFAVGPLAPRSKRKHSAASRYCHDQGSILRVAFILGWYRQ
jgi:hypothetical protein